MVDKDGKVTWADDISNSRYAESATSSFADNLAKSIEKALAEKQQRK